MRKFQDNLIYKIIQSMKIDVLYLQGKLQSINKCEGHDIQYVGFAKHEIFFYIRKVFYYFSTCHYYMLISNVQ